MQYEDPGSNSYWILRRFDFKIRGRVFEGRAEAVNSSTRNTTQRHSFGEHVVSQTSRRNNFSTSTSLLYTAEEYRRFGRSDGGENAGSTRYPHFRPFSMEWLSKAMITAIVVYDIDAVKTEENELTLRQWPMQGCSMNSRWMYNHFTQS